MNLQQQWVAFITLASKEIKRILRIWPQTLLPPAITMSLYFIIFGKMIGSRVGEMGGVPYMQFIVPGLIMMAVITNSYSNVVSSFFSTKFHGSIEEMLVSPISKHTILWVGRGGAFSWGGGWFHSDHVGVIFYQIKHGTCFCHGVYGGDDLSVIFAGRYDKCGVCSFI